MLVDLRWSRPAWPERAGADLAHAAGLGPEQSAALGPPDGSDARARHRVVIRRGRPSPQSRLPATHSLTIAKAHGRLHLTLLLERLLSGRGWSGLAPAERSARLPQPRPATTAKPFARLALAPPPPPPRRLMGQQTLRPERRSSLDDLCDLRDVLLGHRTRSLFPCPPPREARQPPVDCSPLRGRFADEHLLDFSPGTRGRRPSVPPALESDAHRRRFDWLRSARPETVGARPRERPLAALPCPVEIPFRPDSVESFAHRPRRAEKGRRKPTRPMPAVSGSSSSAFEKSHGERSPRDARVLDIAAGTSPSRRRGARREVGPRFSSSDGSDSRA